MRTVKVFDTTLRDGEQTPGAKINLSEKLVIARQLRKLNVDYIEAGFAASSKGDFDAITAIAKEMREGPIVTALARAVKADIDLVYESVKHAGRPMIHVVLGTSSIHVDKKLQKTKEQILEMGVESVKYAKKYLNEVQYSTEDASRSDFDYLMKTIEAVIKAGATIVNVPDTVGYAMPEQFGDLIRRINDRVKNINPNVLLSVHCHNDLGLSSANTLAAIKNGADKVEVTLNGIGERAGNCALEEIVMALRVRSDYFGATTAINTTEIKKTSQLVSHLMGIDIQANKAIVGENAFAHSSGIHQDGLLKSKDVYEIIDPRDIGLTDMEMILTARSGKHALMASVQKLGYVISDESDAERLHKAFLEMADRKKEIYDTDVNYLVQKVIKSPDQNGEAVDLFDLVDFQVISNTLYPTATVKIRHAGGDTVETATGDGPIDAMFKAIENACGKKVVLMEYKINSLSGQFDACGRASIKLSYGNKVFDARAVDTDIIKASAMAFVNGINKIIIDERNEVR